MCLAPSGPGMSRLRGEPDREKIALIAPGVRARELV